MRHPPRLALGLFSALALLQLLQFCQCALQPLVLLTPRTGLRAYKDKFNPVWEPRYLAYPGGLHLPRIMADVAALVSGGYLKIFRK